MNLRSLCRAGSTHLTAAVSLGLLASLALLSSSDAHAAESRSMRFEHLSRESGLSQSFVYTIVQDRDGFLWFGTQEGLNRFDGFEFRVFAHQADNPTTLSDESIRTMIEDSAGTLWIGTDAGGLSRFVPATETFINYLHDPAEPKSISDNRVRVVYEDSVGGLWIGTDGSGLDRLDRETGQFTHFAHDPADPTTISSGHIWDILEDSAGILWIATENGVNRLDRRSGSFQRFVNDPGSTMSLSDNHVRVLFEDAAGNFWVGTENGGLNRFDRATGTFERFIHDPNDPASLNANRINTIFQDDAGELWIGTVAGLHVLDYDTMAFTRYVHSPADRYSLSNDNVIAIYQDRGGVLWIGTYDGLSKWNPATRAMLHFRSEANDVASLSENTVTSFAESPDGNIWVGTFGGGLNLLDRKTSQFSQLRHDPDDTSSLSSDRIMALMTDSRGIVWAGTRSSGLNRIDPVTGSVTRFVHDPDDPRSISANGVTSVLEHDGRILIGTFGGGLNILDPVSGHFSRLQHDPTDPQSLSNDRVLILFQDSGGAIWIGTYGGGLNRYDSATGTFTAIRNEPGDTASLSGNDIYMIQEGPNGDLWVGAKDAGLNHWSAADREAGQARFEHLGELQGLPSDTIYSGIWDDDGRLWLSTARGLSRLDTETLEFRNYDLSHGLQGEEYNLAAGLLTRDGQILFGGLNGFNMFDPARMVNGRRPPQVAVTNFLGLNEAVDLSAYRRNGEPPELDHTTDVISIEYAALDYAAPEKSRYRYRLDGLDDDWVDAGSKRHVTYTNLPAGAYTFRVIAVNNDNVWSQDSAELRFVVMPAPWQTWWAYTVYAAILLLLIGVALRDHNKRVTQAARLAYVDELNLLQGRLSEAQRIANVGNWDWNIETGELWWSDQVYRLFQQDQATFDVSYASFLECVHPDDRARVDDAVQRALRDAERYSIDHRILLPDGSERIVHERAEVFFDNSGKSSRMAGTVYDITDRVLAEASVRRHAVFQELLAGLSSDLVHAQPHDIDARVTDGLRAVGSHYDLDAVSIWWLADDEDSVRSAHRWVRVENRKRRTRFNRQQMPWIAARLLAGETVVVNDVNEMPVPALTDQKAFLERGACSFLLVPLSVDESLRGVCAFSMMRKCIDWSENIVTELKLIAESLAGSIARTRAIIEIEQLRDQLQAENFYLREEVKLAHGFTEIIGEDRELRKCLQAVEKVAPTDIPVLVLGETGTGKELIARAVHKLSNRSEQPMVSVNCPALPANLIESELFGHEKGAFTGAMAARRGRFEVAAGGTLFLDEIGELPLELQSKLLRVLQTGEYERLGGTKTLRTDVRLIAATNRNLEQMVARGEFRSDLYFRIASFPVRLPPLRAREGDIPLLTEHFVHKHSERLGKHVEAVSANMLRELVDYDWPGNVRQLESVIERALISAEKGSVLELPGPLQLITRFQQSDNGASNGDSASLVDVERSHIINVLEQSNWRIGGADGAASALGIPASTLRSKMKRLDISKERS